ALNLVPDHMIDGGNLRTFEIPACKTLQFIDKINPNYYQKDKEIIVFKSPEDLKNKLEFYLSHPKKRKKIIQAGYKKTINYHTFEHRFARLTKQL
ncbi:MAG: glycosyltransferase, partial [Patescibacteria group bacterium]|nr:glycosyltransferase [Patescibacteria group bacterium]